jgi:hypothetical protein
MIISNLNSWHNNNNNNNNANHISSTPINFNSTSTDSNDKSTSKQPRTIVFCKIKTPNIYATKYPMNNNNNNNNNENSKIKKLVKFDEINIKTPKKVLNESKTISLEALSNNKSFQSNSATDMYSISRKNSDLTQKQTQKMNLNRAIGKKLVALNRYNSANSFNKLNLKDNIHSSYLTSGGTVIMNPFASNLDMINKSNPNYSNLSSKLVNRYENIFYNPANRLDQYQASSTQLVQSSKFKEATSDTNLKIFEDASNLSLCKIGALNNETKKIVTLNKTSLLNNEKYERKATFLSEDDDTKNYFLNYRLIKSDKENILNNIKLNNEYKKNLKNKAQSTVLKPKFEDDSSSEFTVHKYLESVKYYYIKNWIEEVERCQRIEGKCLETMNKIVFNDD